MSQAAVLTTALALAFAAVLAFVLLSGQRPPVWRKRCEIALRVIAVALYLGALVWGLMTARTSGWLGLAVQPILWIWVLFNVVRARRRKAALQARQPGTFA